MDSENAMSPEEVLAQMGCLLLNDLFFLLVFANPVFLLYRTPSSLLVCSFYALRLASDGTPPVGYETISSALLSFLSTITTKVLASNSYMVSNRALPKPGHAN
jgi:hypothetical protein